MHLSARQIEEISSFLPTLYELRDLDSFAEHVVRAMPALIATDSVGLNEVNAAHNRFRAVVRPSPEQFGVRDADEILHRRMQEHPLIVRQHRTRETRAMTLSEVISSRDFHRLGLYQEFFRPMRIEHLMVSAFHLRANDDRVAIVLARQRRDFDGTERATLNLLRPHLQQAYCNAEALSDLEHSFGRIENALEESASCAVMVVRGSRIARATQRARRMLRRYCAPARRTVAESLPDSIASWMRENIESRGGDRVLGRAWAPLVIEGERGELVVRMVPADSWREVIVMLSEHSRDAPAQVLARLGLSGREAEVLLWTSRAKTNAETALILGISRRTVDKHLERILAKLEVETRVAAAALAWQALNTAASH